MPEFVTLKNAHRTKSLRTRGVGLPLIFLLIFVASSFAALTSLAIQQRLINQTGLDNRLKAKYAANAATQLTLVQLREDASFLSPSGTWHSDDFPELKLSDPRLSFEVCLLYTSPSPRDRTRSRMPSSA